MKRILILFCSIVISTASPVFAQHHAASSQSIPTHARSTSTQVAPGFSRNGISPRTWNGSRTFSARTFSSSRNWNRHRRVIFVGGFGYPFFDYGWDYPYYGYYPYPYYGYSNYYPDSSAANYYGNAQPAYDNGAYRSRGGSIVLEVQRRLAREGFYKGSLDGAVGSRTHYAIRAYERSHGLRVDGEINDELLGSMGMR